MPTFQEINDKLIRVKKDIATDKESMMLIASAMVNVKSLNEIDFDRIRIEDICEMHDRIFEMISNENDDGEVTIDPSHPFGVIQSIQHKIFKLEEKPKKRVASTFRFL